MRKITIILFLWILCVPIFGQKQGLSTITAEFVKDSLHGEFVEIRSVRTLDGGNGGWIFAPDEPLGVKILKRKIIAGQIVATIWIKTSNVEDTTHLEGRLRLTYKNLDGDLELTKIEDDGLSRKQTFPSSAITANSNIYNPPQRFQTPIANSTFHVAAGRFVYFPFFLNRRSFVNGTFSARGGRNDIDGIIVDEFEFVNYKAGTVWRTYYQSGYVALGRIGITLEPGNYYLIFSNSAALVTNKTVTASVFFQSQ